jgi:hypothetical protein
LEELHFKNFRSISVSSIQTGLSLLALASKKTETRDQFYEIFEAPQGCFKNIVFIPPREIAQNPPYH